MNNLLGLVKGWSERLTINLLGFFPKVNKQTLSNLKDAYNKQNADIEAAKDDLISKNPESLADITNIHGLIKTLWPVVAILAFLAAWFLFVKFYYKKYRR